MKGLRMARISFPMWLSLHWAMRSREIWVAEVKQEFKVLLPHSLLASGPTSSHRAMSRPFPLTLSLLRLQAVSAYLWMMSPTPASAGHSHQGQGQQSDRPCGLQLVLVLPISHLLWTEL